MGDQIEGSPKKDTSKKSFTEQYENALPFFLSIGMTPDQFYKEDVTLTRFYLKAELERRKQKNFDSWLQGLYVYEAFAVVEGNINRKKGTKAREYTDKPYDIYGARTKVEQEAKVKEAKAQMLHWMYSLVEKYNKS